MTGEPMAFGSYVGLAGGPPPGTGPAVLPLTPEARGRISPEGGWRPTRTSPAAAETSSFQAQLASLADCVSVLDHQMAEVTSSVASVNTQIAETFMTQIRELKDMITRESAARFAQAGVFATETRERFDRMNGELERASYQGAQGLQRANEEISRVSDDLGRVKAEGDAGRGVRRDGEKEKFPMVSRRGFETVDKLDGEIAGFKDWTFKLKAFVRIEPGFEEFLIAIEDLVKPPEKSDVDAHTRTTGKPADWFDEQLYIILVNKSVASSKALSVVRSCETHLGYRGSLAWHRIAQEGKGGRGELRQEALRDAAREPPPCVNNSEILVRITDWESAMRIYQK